MPDCEMCGKEEEVLSKAVIEGVMMKVCADCSRTGVVVEKPEPKLEHFAKRKQQAVEKPEAPTYIVSSDFAEKVRSAREKMELTQEKLAEAIAEKESVIQHVESGKLTPSLKLARKFEQFLHIYLIEEYEEKKMDKEKIDFKDSALTIGDLIKLKKE